MENKKFNRAILLSWIFVAGGIFGFVYEEMFYRIDLNMWTKRGTTYGPWIPIYAYGAVLIVLLTARLKSKPVLVFLVSMLACGVLEFLTGYVLFNYLGTRLWDYNTEIWNFGNIGGYVCLRSVVFFGASGVLLQYAICPALKWLMSLIKSRIILCLSVIPFIAFVVDIIAYKLSLF